MVNVQFMLTVNRLDLIDWLFVDQYSGLPNPSITSYESAVTFPTRERLLPTYSDISYLVGALPGLTSTFSTQSQHRFFFAAYLFTARRGHFSAWWPGTRILSLTQRGLLLYIFNFSFPIVLIYYITLHTFRTQIHTPSTHSFVHCRWGFNNEDTKVFFKKQG